MMAVKINRRQRIALHIIIKQLIKLRKHNGLVVVARQQHDGRGRMGNGENNVAVYTLGKLCASKGGICADGVPLPQIHVVRKIICHEIGGGFAEYEQPAKIAVAVALQKLGAVGRQLPRLGLLGR